VNAPTTAMRLPLYSMRGVKSRSPTAGMDHTSGRISIMRRIIHRQEDELQTQVDKAFAALNGWRHTMRIFRSKLLPAVPLMQSGGSGRYVGIQTGGSSIPSGFVHWQRQQTDLLLVVDVNPVALPAARVDARVGGRKGLAVLGDHDDSDCNQFACLHGGGD
jgi:hypothetical protein